MSQGALLVIAIGVILIYFELRTIREDLVAIRTGSVLTPVPPHEAAHAVPDEDKLRPISHSDEDLYQMELRRKENFR